MSRSSSPSSKSGVGASRWPRRLPTRPLTSPFESGGDHRHLHLLTEIVVDDRPEDDVGLLVGVVGDDPGRLGGLVEVIEEGPATERRTPLAPSIEVSSIGLEMARSAACFARFSPVARPMPMTAEPASDMMVRTSAKSTLIKPGSRDQIGDAGDTAHQDVIGQPEGLGDRGFGVADVEQPVVGDDDQGVDRLLEIVDPLLGVDGATSALEAERAG